MYGGILKATNANPTSGVPTPGSFIAGDLLAEGAAVSIQITGTYAGTPVFQQSIDGANWVTVSSSNITNLGTGAAGFSSGITGIFLVTGLAPGADWRLYLSSYTSGAAVVSVLPSLVGALGGSGSGSGASSSSFALQNVGTTAVSNGAGLSYVEETLASGATGTAFSTVSSFLAYPTRGYVIVTNPNTNCNLYLKECPVSAGVSVSATSFLWVIPPVRSQVLPIGNLLDLRWFTDIASGNATGIFCEAY